MKTSQNPSVYGHYAAITPSDSVAYADGEAQAVWVGGAGVVVLIRPDGTAVNFTAVAGSIIPCRSIRVNATNTTATLMVALYNYKGSK